MQEMKLQDLKTKSPTELLSFAEEVAVENASAMRKQELMFAILKQLAARDVEITGTGVVEVLQDGFGFLRSPDSNYLAGPDDIYVSPSQIRRFGLRTGDTVEGQIREPERRRALFRPAQGQHHQFRGPGEAAPQGPFRQSDAALSRRVAGDGDRGSRPVKDNTGRVIDIVSPIGKGQRGLIVAQPRTGKTVILQNIAHADHRQPSRVLPDRAADRRAARGSDRHAALGEGRGDLLHLRRAGHRATCRSPRW